MMMSTSSNQVVKVKRENLEACLTCPICNELFREATTISECLHTFCKQCIYEKVFNEDFDRCPVCKTDLGVSPMEKLRGDNSLEDIKTKLFPSGSKKVKARAVDRNLPEKVLPSETRKTKAPEVGVPFITSPRRRKQRYLSSLGRSIPSVTVKSSTSGRKYSTRKILAVQERHLSTQEEPGHNLEDFSERVKSSENLKEDAVYVRQNTTEKLSKKDEENNGNKHKEQPRWTTEVMETEREPARVPRGVLLNLNDAPEEPKPFQEYGNNGEPTPAPLGSVPGAKGPLGCKKKAVSEPEEFKTPAQRVVSDVINEGERRIKPIWFSLEAFPWEGYAPLPQMPSCYLRVKDGNLPSSYIKKYLVKRLNLHSEAEVEILLWGRPINPTLLLHNLVDLWLQNIPASHKIEPTVGSSAEEYVMVITYCRKVQQRW